MDFPFAVILCLFSFKREVFGGGSYGKSAGGMSMLTAWPSSVLDLIFSSSFWDVLRSIIFMGFGRST